MYLQLYLHVEDEFMKLKFKQNILLMVRALYFCMEKEWAELGMKYNITPAQQHILFLLSTNKKTLTPTQISELGCWHTSTVTRLLKPLQSKEFITVSADKKHLKYKKVTITQEGEIMFQKLVNSFKEMERFPFDMRHISEEEIIQFLNCGQSILDVHKGEDFKKRVINAQIEGLDYA